MRRYGLRDDQWDRIKDFLPGRDGHVGGTAADNRLFVEAVLFRFRAGIPWRDLPGRFGDWKIAYQRFNRWAKSGVFERVFKALASDPDNEYMMIDATIVRAHQHSAGGCRELTGARRCTRRVPRRSIRRIRVGWARGAAGVLASRLGCASKGDVPFVHRRCRTAWPGASLPG